MTHRTWLITGVSSGFGRELTDQLLQRGGRVAGTVRDTAKVTDLTAQHSGTFRAEVLDVTDTAAVREVVDRSFAKLGHVDVVVSNAGYGLFGAAESSPTRRSTTSLPPTSPAPSSSSGPPCRTYAEQGGGRIIQISFYGGQVAFPGNSLYHPPIGASRASPTQWPRKSRPSASA